MNEILVIAAIVCVVVLILFVLRKNRDKKELIDLLNSEDKTVSQQHSETDSDEE
jgi:preprotein translocase subunit SecG